MKNGDTMDQIARRCKLTPLERKVARVMFTGEGVQTMTLAECAAKVGASQGLAYRAFRTLCGKIAHNCWQKPESKGRANHEG